MSILPPWGEWADAEWDGEFSILYDTAIAAARILEPIDALYPAADDDDDDDTFDKWKAAVDKTEFPKLIEKADNMANEQWIDFVCFGGVKPDWTEEQFWILVHQPEWRLDTAEEDQPESPIDFGKIDDVTA